ncbi:echinoderm microtubule-associated protein-like CG42247 isoform X3 [Argopecten irradians]|uniref:echinoderm microtubule-associated protein-like CG42247 isoform X3 n=1 Tax=Argopecten irradians TaxID=31199 RepID=UPI0037130142
MADYERIPGFVSGGFDMYQRDRFYSEKQKYMQLLASQERRKERYKKRDKQRRSRKNRRTDEDIVRTGSEEEYEKPPRQRRNTRKRSMHKRDDELMASIERREWILRQQMDKNKQHYLSPKDTKLPGEYSYRSSYQQESRDFPSYTEAKKTAPPVYHAAETEKASHIPMVQRPIYEGQPELPPIPEKPRYYTHIPLPETVQYGGQTDRSDNGREDARNKRASVLNRVEKLLNDMNRQMNEGEIILKSNVKRRHQRQYVKRKEDTDSGDENYVFVKTAVTPTPVTSYYESEVDVSLPSLPASSLGPQGPSRMSFPSGVKSDIQGAYSDEEDGQPGNRPYTDSYRGHPFTLGGENRFKKHGADPSDGFVKTVPALHHGKQKDDGTRASLVTFYISGDRNYKGLQLAVSSKTWPNIEKFKDHLTKKIGTTWPIMNIYAIPTGELIDDLIKLQNNRSYIVCKDSKPQLAKIEYGYSHEKHWITKPPSAGKFRKKDISMLKQNAPANSPSKNRRVITIIQNKNRIRKEKVILNPQTSMSFDQILSDMGDMINMNATALYLYKKPETRVTSYSQLFRDFKTVDEFIICGEEMVPVPDSTGQKRAAPSSNSSNESVTSRGSRQKKMQKSHDYEQPDYLDYNGDIEQYNDTDYDDRRRWEDPFEQVAYDDSLDTDEESAKKVKVRMRGRYKEYFLPERPTPDNRSKPNGKLLLEWLYGYCSNNNNNSMMVYHKTGELVCYMDAAVVFYNKTFDHQRFYLAHTEEVTCMALHPDGRWIATGQKAGSSPEDVAHIRIWDGRTLSTQVILGVGIFSRGVSSVNFRQNPDGALLCAVDSSDKHILTVWDWNRKRLLAKTTTTTRSVSSACFYPRDDTVLITYGDQHLYFWKLFWDPALDTDGRLLRDKESGSFLFPPTSNLDSDEPREILSIAFLRNGFVATGDSTGAVIIWAVDPTLVCRFLVALSDPHHKPVNSLCFLSNNTLISGGGKEIKAWNTSTNHFRKIHERILVDNAGDVASIVVRDKAVVDGSMPVLYIGTKTSCIFEGSFENKLEKHIDAHFDDVSAVVSHPRENSFYSASMDMTIKKWVTDGSEKRGKPITYDVERPCTCIDIDSKGRYLAVGTSDGHVKILPSALKQKSEINDIIVGTSQPKPPFIMCVKISPERDTLAVGCHDGCVYIYNDVNDPSRVTIRNNTIFKANPCSVINVDWSINSHYIQTMSADYDLFHWDVTDMVATRAIEFRDAEWSTQNVTVGYNVCGVWTNLKDDDEVKVMDRSPNKELVAAGDSKGGIRLYNYPCVGVKPEYKVTRMYSNEVTALSFLARTARLISCGGQKSVLAQWRVEKYITSNEH